MSSPECFLLALQGSDGQKIVLEFESEHYLNGKLNAANALGMWVRRLTVEDFQSEEYRDTKFYEMRHSATSRIFHLELWQNYLMSKDEVPFRSEEPSHSE